MKKNTKWTISIFAIIIISIGIFYFSNQSVPYKNYDVLAKCLSEKNAKFYGAFWCPHCNRQKELFGNSMQFINYVECSTPDGKAQTQVCKDAQIQSYPTWEFADGKKAVGVKSMNELASLSGCALT